MAKIKTIIIKNKKIIGVKIIIAVPIVPVLCITNTIKSVTNSKPNIVDIVFLLFVFIPMSIDASTYLLAHGEDYAYSIC